MIYYLAPDGKDSNPGTYSAPWANPQNAYPKMQPGDQLVLKNGTYKGLILIRADIVPPSGTTAAYTTIKAETFGQVIVDGQGTVSPMNMAGPALKPCQYIAIDGIVFRHQQSGCSFYQVNHVKLTRCGFEDAGSGNTATLNFSHSSYCLAEDCFIWGSGRYRILAYYSDHVVIRRATARIDSVDAGGGPLGGISLYNSNNIEVQNCIVLDSTADQKWTNVDEYDGAYTIPSTGGQSSNINITGCIALNNALQFLTITKNVVNAKVNNSVGYHIQQGIFARDNVSLDHCTFGDVTGPDRNAINGGTTGLQWVQGDDPVNSTSITNSILTGIKGTALNGWAKSQGNVFWNNTADVGGGTVKGAGDVSQNPNLKFITDSGDALHGAVVRKSIGVSGTLYGDPGYNATQSTELWPFPNEAIIQQFMSSTSQRGFCAPGQTLTGYIWTWLGSANPYAGGTPPPPPVAKTAVLKFIADPTLDGKITAVRLVNGQIEFDYTGKLIEDATDLDPDDIQKGHPAAQPGIRQFVIVGNQMNTGQP